MTSDLTPTPRRAALRAAAMRRRRRTRALVGGATVTAIALIGVPLVSSMAQPTPSARSAVAAGAQTLQVSETVAPQAVTRDSFAASDPVAEYVAGGTNADWAKLVLTFGEFPVTEQNVTVFTRWMRQENYTDSWWQRNNPLNNGWGSGGGGGLGSYDSLVIAAQNAAEGLREFPGYSGIVAALEASADPDVTAAAIWASPWASSHYANGANWSTTAVPLVVAPADAWK